VFVVELEFTFNEEYVKIQISDDAILFTVHFHSPCACLG